MTDLPQTFDIQDSRDLRSKLERELQRLIAARTRDEIADHAFNFAVTAWHMCDWVGRDIANARKTDPSTGEPLVQPKVEDLGIRDGMNQDEIIRAVQTYAGHHGPSLRLCQTLANASKHSEPLRRAEAAEVIMVRSPEWKAVVVLGDGSQIEAIQMFEAIHEFWFRFIYDRSIG